MNENQKSDADYEKRITQLEKDKENLKELIAKVHSNYLQLEKELKILKTEIHKD